MSTSYFVHERGSRIAIFIYSLQTGVFLGVPIATQIIQKSSLAWASGAMAIAEGICLIVLFLFFEETAYRRAHVDVLAHRQAPPETPTEVEKPSSGHTERVATPTTNDDMRRLPYLKRLSLYQGRLSNQSPLVLTYRVLALIFHPTILWAAVTGLPASWLVGLSYTINALLAPPPWNFSNIAIGNMYIAGWIGCTFGMILAFPNDWLAKLAAKRNGSVYEPEFRLFMVAPAAICCVLGFALWGWGGSNGVSWPAMAVFFVIAAAGAVWINAALISYLIDAHRQFAIESQIILFAFKNLMPFGVGYFFVP